MKVADFLNASAIIPSLKAREKNAVLREMAQLAASRCRVADEQELLGILLKREEVSSTGIGEGVAIPHGRMPGVRKVVAVFARSPQGVDFQSPDKKLTHLLFLLIAPEDSSADHLKALARISRLLKDAAFRAKLMEVKTSEEILQTIKAEDEKF